MPRVVRARAEQMAGELAVDVVTARAVAPLDRLAALALGLLKPGGIVLAVKGAKACGGGPGREGGAQAAGCARTWRFSSPGAVRSIRLQQWSG